MGCCIGSCMGAAIGRRLPLEVREFSNGVQGGGSSFSASMMMTMMDDNDNTMTQKSCSCSLRRACGLQMTPTRLQKATLVQCAYIIMPKQAFLCFCTYTHAQTAKHPLPTYLHGHPGAQQLIGGAPDVAAVVIETGLDPVGRQTQHLYRELPQVRLVCDALRNLQHDDVCQAHCKGEVVKILHPLHFDVKRIRSKKKKLFSILSVSPTAKQERHFFGDKNSQFRCSFARRKGYVAFVHSILLKTTGFKFCCFFLFCVQIFCCLFRIRSTPLLATMFHNFRFPFCQAFRES